MKKDEQQGKNFEKLLFFLRRLRDMYEEAARMDFHVLLEERDDGADEDVLITAVDRIKGSIKEGKYRQDQSDSAGAGVPVIAYDADDIDISRTWDQMSLADIEVFLRCLKFSARDEFLLLHYDDTVMWGNTELKDVDDIWNVYGGLLKECRSPVINLYSFEYVLLPFAKFRNLNEAPEYELSEVENRIREAGDGYVEFSEKLDGSFIQMRYIGDDRFTDGIIITSSGSINPNRSAQLADVVRYMREEEGSDAEKIKTMLTENDHLTFIFEWIDERDPHVVSYPDEMQGLHLVGMRDVKTGELYTYSGVIEKATRYGIRSTSLYSMTLPEVLESLDTVKGTEHEGYVLNAGGFLVKIKCPDFLNLMHSVEISRSFNTIVRYAAEGKADDFISMLPAGYQEDAWKKLRKLMTFEQDVRSRVEEEYAKIPMDADRKTAMLMIDRIPEKMIKGYVRARYLGKPVEIIAQKKSDSFQYIKESDIDRYYAEEALGRMALQVC